MALNMPIEEMRIINARNPKNQDAALEEMISIWTETGENDLSWDRVVYAFRAIGEHKLADSIEEDSDFC